jgi:phosphotransferase system HPr (HPr) family protein
MGNAPVSQILLIKGAQGLHARPAELFARTAMQYEAAIELMRAEIRVDAKSVLQLLTLGADQGTELVLEARGVDARQAVEALVQLVDRDFADEKTLNQEQAR